MAWQMSCCRLSICDASVPRWMSSWNTTWAPGGSPPQRASLGPAAPEPPLSGRSPQSACVLSERVLCRKRGANGEWQNGEWRMANGGMANGEFFGGKNLSSNCRCTWVEQKKNYFFYKKKLICQQIVDTRLCVIHVDAKHWTLQPGGSAAACSTTGAYNSSMGTEMVSRDVCGFVSTMNLYRAYHPAPGSCAETGDPVQSFTLCHHPGSLCRHHPGSESATVQRQTTKTTHFHFIFPHHFPMPFPHLYGPVSGVGKIVHKQIRWA